MNESQLVQTIKAHIAKGDKAKDKADQHYIAAGQHLKTLKAQHGGTWAEWEALLKEKIGIGKSRASELMQIADGTKTLEGVRADTAERTAKTRALQSSPLRSGENAGEPEASVEEDGKARKQPAKKLGAMSRAEIKKRAGLLANDRKKERLVTAIKAELESAEESEREVISAITELLYLLPQLRPEMRAKLFALLWEKFRDELIEAQTVSYERAFPPKRGRGRPPGSKNKSPPAENTAAPPQRGEDNAPAPEVGAEIMKAKMAALEDGIPEVLRREPNAAAA
jgi:hypothetical protein